jgi:DNA-binding NarL/FixJ family response regulator
MTTRWRNPRGEPTEQQLRVLAARYLGGTNERAARLLDLSPNTVRNHLEALYMTLDVRSAIDALGVLGWVHLPADLEAEMGACLSRLPEEP